MPKTKSKLFSEHPGYFEVEVRLKFGRKLAFGFAADSGWYYILQSKSGRRTRCVTQAKDGLRPVDLVLVLFKYTGRAVRFFCWEKQWPPAT